MINDKKIHQSARKANNREEKVLFEISKKNSFHERMMLKLNPAGCIDGGNLGSEGWQRIFQNKLISRAKIPNKKKKMKEVNGAGALQSKKKCIGHLRIIGRVRRQQVS